MGMAGLRERWLAKQQQANSDGESTEMLSSKLKIYLGQAPLDNQRFQVVYLSINYKLKTMNVPLACAMLGAFLCPSGFSGTLLNEQYRVQTGVNLGTALSLSHIFSEHVKISDQVTIACHNVAKTMLPTQLRFQQKMQYNLCFPFV